MFEAITFKKPWISLQKLDLGWSDDLKYVIVTQGQEKYLIRVSPISTFEKRQSQFKLLKSLMQQKLDVPKAFEFDILDEVHCYMILSYQEGVDARGIVSTLDDKSQYRLGLKAGNILKSIHDIAIETQTEATWYDIFSKKLIPKITRFNDCKLPIPKKEIVVSYVESNKDILKTRNMRFTHGDFHIGNMIIDHKDIKIIDFDKVGYADAYDDFKPFVWNVFESKWFATGMIDGYFMYRIPKDFFPILKLYAAESLISHIPWAQKFGEKEVDTAFKVYHHVMQWYDDFKLDIPTWYQNYLDL